MNRFRLAMIAALGIAIADAGSHGTVKQAQLPKEDAELYAYDSVTTLDLVEHGRTVVDGITRIEADYASPQGGRVPATILVPPGKGPFAAVIFMHGGGGKRSDFLSEALAFAPSGAVCILLDAPFRRPGGAPLFGFTPADRDGIVQAVVDIRRAVDLLATRKDVDVSRIAYVGFSYGATLGGILSGVEHRFHGIVLMASGSFVGFARELSESRKWKDPSELNAYINAIETITPERYIGYAAPTAILFQNGRQDPGISIAEAEEMHRLSNGLTTVQWYDAGHSLNERALEDRAAWLQSILALSSKPR